MGLFPGSNQFTRYKKTTEPLVRTPAWLQQALDIYAIHGNGIFEIGALKEGQERVYDRCYEFQDINYAGQNPEVQEQICLTFCRFLNGMGSDFKIITAGEDIDREAEEHSLLTDPEGSGYPELSEYNNGLIQYSLRRGKPGIRRRHFLVVTAREKGMAEAMERFQVMDATIAPIFESLGTKLIPQPAEERLAFLRGFFHPGEEPVHYSFEDFGRRKRNWRNEILPRRIGNHDDYLDFGDKLVSILYAAALPSQLNEEKTVNTLSSFPFPTMLALDTACVLRQALKSLLNRINQANDVAINRENEANARAGNYSGMVSLRKRTTKQVMEDTLDQVDRNDENAFFVGILVAVSGRDREELERNVSAVKMKADTLTITLAPYSYLQLQAMNTVLPIGARRVNNMRTMLTTSYVALQPFYAFDLIQPGGFWYGTNKRTGNIIMGDRKTLKSGNGVIVGHTGSGKSMILKITEIGQTLLRTNDDIFMIDPQNEMRNIVPVFGGDFFDLSASSGICLNPLEAPDAVLFAEDPAVQDGFIAEQSEFVEAFLYSILNIEPDGVLKSVIYRAVEETYRKAFGSERPVSPLLSDLKDALEKIREPEARALYKSLEAYTDFSYQTLSGQSTFETSKRFVVFGMGGVPNNMWEPIMLTVMHLLTQRINFNQRLQKATHFIVDEAQWVCTHESSAQELQKAYLTYRKYGGICTICLQNASAAMANGAIQSIVSNSDFKLFLDQGGNDRNVLASLINMSEEEFQALANPEVGQCLLVWGGRIILCDSRIPKENPLYGLYTTNFHEKAAGKSDQKRVRPGSQAQD